MAMSDVASIAAMPLYTNLDRIARDLVALGIGPADPIPPDRLFEIDQWHYHGTETLAVAAEFLRIGSASHVLDIGSGIGGPARYLAYTYGCHVTAVELQPALHAIAVDLTHRCGLVDRVTQVCGDALTYPLPDDEFDAAISLLAVLHIPDRRRLFTRLAHALRPGGACYIEDLSMRASFAPADARDVRNVVYGINVTTPAEYVADLRAAGFADVRATDLTPDWAPFAAERVQAWRQNHAGYAAVHGEAAWAAQDRFFALIDRLYRSGSLGGIRLTARKP
jgi:SAM-dependent methyltransferase